MKNKISLYLIIIFSLLAIFQSRAISDKVSIIYVVENQPITNVEINNEIKYLLLINPKLKEIDKETLVKYASKSILKEKIKELEIIKYYKFGKNKNIVNNNLNRMMLNLNITEENEFNSLLSSIDLSKEFLSKKIEIELIWNRLIYEMYKDKLLIDEEEIKEKLKTTINNQANKVNEYNLYEILFSPKTTSDLDADIQKITKSIQDIGFENTANIFSISNSSKFGGKIGWINENQLSKIILKKISELNIGEITDPINVPSGKLILFLKDKRQVKNDLSLEDQLSKKVNSERNKQLNRFSAIYYKKIELNTKIYER